MEKAKASSASTGGGHPGAGPPSVPRPSLSAALLGSFSPFSLGDPGHVPKPARTGSGELFFGF